MPTVTIVHLDDEDTAKAVGKFIGAEFQLAVTVIDRSTPNPTLSRASDLLIILVPKPSSPLRRPTDEYQDLRSAAQSDKAVVICDPTDDVEFDASVLARVDVGRWRAELVRALESILPSARGSIVNEYQPFLYLGLSSDLGNSVGGEGPIEPVHTHGTEARTFVGPGGILFPGTLSIRLVTDQLPVGKAPRTFCTWVYFFELPQIRVNSDLSSAVPQFIFSYGEETHGGAFGAYFGVPFFPDAMTRYAGLRVFFWSSPAKWEESSSDGDTAPFAPAAAKEWIHVAVSWDGQTVKAYANGSLVLTTDRDHETGLSNVLTIGGFLDGREDTYSGFKPQAYIREFLGFDRVLSGADIRELRNRTARIAGISNDGKD